MAPERCQELHSPPVLILYGYPTLWRADVNRPITEMEKSASAENAESASMLEVLGTMGAP